MQRGCAYRARQHTTMHARHAIRLRLCQGTARFTMCPCGSAAVSTRLLTRRATRLARAARRTSRHSQRACTPNLMRVVAQHAPYTKRRLRARECAACDAAGCERPSSRTPVAPSVSRRSCAHCACAHGARLHPQLASACFSRVSAAEAPLRRRGAPRSLQHGAGGAARAALAPPRRSRHPEPAALRPRRGLSGAR